ncbi:MAG TPA: 50S ribosomal protein L4 [Anaerolineales bacterium]|nr:50S ribosomal protein L4 [Anaerolineales bacterium]
MKVDVVNMQGEKVKTVDLPVEIFETQINKDLMHQALMLQLANARLGTHKTKTRSEVSGGGRKPWKQKGTGRARQGSIRSAQWVGGGKIHTPRPRKYTKLMPRQMRRNAIRSALSVKASDAAIVVLDELTLPEAKTKLMAQALNRLVGDASALILVAEKNSSYDVVTRSTNNIPDAKILMASYLNIRDLFKYEKLVLPLSALDVLKTYLV